MVAGAFLRRAARFVRLTIAKARRDRVALEASALAFGTVLALVPLVAAFLFVGRYVFEEYHQQVLAVLRQFLPYGEATIMERIDEFLAQAERIRGIGVIGFVTAAIGTFAAIEGAFNRIWHVSSRRPWRIRAYSFAMLLLWGPLLIGAVHSGLLVLGTRPGFARLLDESLFLQALPLVSTFVGLTMLYWRVPFTAVRFKCALAGGAFAALALEALRRGFALYLEAFPGLSLIYGSFALALLFMISIQLAWQIVLLGSEVAYTAQHFTSMGVRRTSAGPMDGGWLGLAVLAILALRLRRGEPYTSLEVLADCLELPADDVRQALRPLREAGFVQEGGRKGEGFVLGSSPDRLSVAGVLAAYEPYQTQVLAALPEEVAELFAVLRRALVAGERRAAELTLADLITPPPAPAAHPAAGTGGPEPPAAA